MLYGGSPVRGRNWGHSSVPFCQGSSLIASKEMTPTPLPSIDSLFNAFGATPPSQAILSRRYEESAFGVSTLEATKLHAESARTSRTG